MYILGDGDSAVVVPFVAGGDDTVVVVSFATGGAVIAGGECVTYGDGSIIRILDTLL